MVRTLLFLVASGFLALQAAVLIAAFDEAMNISRREALSQRRRIAHELRSRGWPA